MTDGCRIPISLGVLDRNERAGGFYGRHGWVEDGATKVDERGELRFFERRVKLRGANITA